MKTSRVGLMVAVGAAVVLIGTGITLAKSHDAGSHPRGSRGHGGPHGGPANQVPGGHDHGGKHAKGGAACDAASSVIGAFVDTACPCDGVDDGNGGTVAWKNHGQYVRCVAHAIREAVRAAGVKRRCARSLVPCAARSTCGKKGGAVACVVSTVGTCTAGACSNDPETACAADADCATRACAVTSADHCADVGGAAGSGSCCTASPSGAFVTAPRDDS